MTVVTRFAPSPTGFLHIGGARTALFNWLFSRHHGGTFRLRIEDTDRKRSTAEAIQRIVDGLDWLGLDWDGEAVYQSANVDRHATIARQLLADGRAYNCYATPEQLAAMREEARAAGRTRLYDGTWRDRDPADAPAGADPVVRVKMPLDGATAIDDAVQGEVTVENRQLDDFILLRADGTPTYMLAVVVDDHDMDVTHIIRGDDHLNNAVRQYHLYRACEWTPPQFAHVPLIHGADGAKLSKRHGALGVEAYREMGYLPDALANYLLRLGWSHGDAELISRDEAIGWFDLDAIGRSPARFDGDKLANLNGHYLRAADNRHLAELVAPRIAEALATTLAPAVMARLQDGMESLKQRASTLQKLAENAQFYCQKLPLSMSGKARRLLDGDGRTRLADLATRLGELTSWDEAEIEALVRAHAEARSLKLGELAQPLRAALTGATASPGIFEVMAVLGRDEVAARLDAATQD